MANRHHAFCNDICEGCSNIPHSVCNYKNALIKRFKRSFVYLNYNQLNEDQSRYVLKLYELKTGRKYNEWTEEVKSIVKAAFGNYDDLILC